MKIKLWMLALLPLAVGCQAQQGAKAINTCPTPGAGVYAPLNPVGSTSNPPVTVGSYKDSAATGQTVCYIGESNFNGGISAPSNVIGPFVVPSGAAVQITITMPSGTNTSGYSWTISRVAATVVYPTAPALNTNPAIAEQAAPTGDPAITLATLTARVVRR